MTIPELDTATVRSRSTTPAMIADVLRSAIMAGKLPGGALLRQMELSAQFGSSRIPVREALRQLQGEGLVTIVPHRGAVVSSLSLAELQEICEIRIAPVVPARWWLRNYRHSCDSVSVWMDAESSHASRMAGRRHCAFGSCE